MFFLHRAAHMILHSYKEVQKRSHKQKGQKGYILEPQNVLHNKRPYPYIRKTKYNRQEVKMRTRHEVDSSTWYLVRVFKIYLRQEKKRKRRKQRKERNGVFLFQVGSCCVRSEVVSTNTCRFCCRGPSQA